MRPFDDEDINTFFNLGLSVPTRTLYIGSVDTIGRSAEEESGTDFRMAERVIKGLHVLNAMGQEPISVYLNNVGGDEYHGLAIYDAIKMSKSMTTVFVVGQASSMGSVISQAGNKRIMDKHSVMMVHMGDLSAHVDQRDIEANAREWGRINNLIYEIYLGRMREKNPRYSSNQLKELLSTDRYLSPQEAVDLGLADEVRS